MLPQFKGDSKERQHKETLVLGLVPHIRNALLGKGIVFPIVVQHIFAEGRSGVAFTQTGGKGFVSGF